MKEIAAADSSMVNPEMLQEGALRRSQIEAEIEDGRALSGAFRARADDSIKARVSSRMQLLVKTIMIARPTFEPVILTSVWHAVHVITLPIFGKPLASSLFVPCCCGLLARSSLRARENVSRGQGPFSKQQPRRKCHSLP
jgi:hypothetical protein